MTSHFKPTPVQKTDSELSSSEDLRVWISNFLAYTWKANRVWSRILEEISCWTNSWFSQRKTQLSCFCILVTIKEETWGKMRTFPRLKRQIYQSHTRSSFGFEVSTRAHSWRVEAGRYRIHWRDAQRKPIYHPILSRAPVAVPNFKSVVATHPHPLLLWNTMNSVNAITICWCKNTFVHAWAYGTKPSKKPKRVTSHLSPTDPSGGKSEATFGVTNVSCTKMEHTFLVLMQFS